MTAQIWATNKGGRISLPYAFTEQGIYILMTVLKGNLATKQSIALIDAFKQMKDYIVESNNLKCGALLKTLKLTLRRLFNCSTDHQNDKYINCSYF